jgi:hypothetical protein
MFDMGDNVRRENCDLRVRLWPIMKLLQVCLLLTASSVCFPQEPTADEKTRMEKEFPIILEIESSYVSDTSGIDPRKLAEATAMGSAPPTFAVFKGTLSAYSATPERERHWQFGCWAENARYAQNPCADMHIGLHRARWVHNRELLEVFAYDGEGNVTLRYIDVTIDPKNPPPADDPIETLPAFAGFFNTSDQTRRDYPVLVHVYGSVALSLPAGELPARTSCDIKDTYINQTTHIDCRQYPPIELHRGYVVVDAGIDGVRQRNVSCDAKWRWSNCSVIGPGLYEARWKDSGHSQIVLLGKRNGKTVDLGFEVR